MSVEDAAWAAAILGIAEWTGEDPKTIAKLVGDRPRDAESEQGEQDDGGRG
ncbi:MAG: hypothetical protein QM820_46975 [Minicystis sp.]